MRRHMTQDGAEMIEADGVFEKGFVKTTALVGSGFRRAKSPVGLAVLVGIAIPTGALLTGGEAGVEMGTQMAGGVNDGLVEPLLDGRNVSVSVEEGAESGSAFDLQVGDQETGGAASSDAAGVGGAAVGGTVTFNVKSGNYPWQVVREACGVTDDSQIKAIVDRSPQLVDLQPNTTVEVNC